MDNEDEAADVKAWRGNRRSSFAQAHHASERARQTERASLSHPDASPPVPVQRRKESKVHISVTETPPPPGGQNVLTLSALENLKEAFELLDSAREGKLDREGFVKTCMDIREVSKRMSKGDIEQLFMKVDVNNNGQVDWNDFTSFILLQQMSSDDGAVKEYAPYIRMKLQGDQSFEESPEESEADKEEDDLVMTASTHKFQKGGGGSVFKQSPVIEKIIKLNAIQTYVSCSQDGILKLWHTDSLKLLRTQENGKAWISDIAAMAQQPLAAFAMDRSITFYDTGRLSFDELGRIKNLENVPLCGTWIRTTDSDKLLYGDDVGLLHVFNFSDEWGGENPKVAPGMADHLLPGMTEERPWRIHTSWITRLQYLKHSSSLLSCSLDGQLMMLDLEKERKKWSGKEHSHGVFAFAYGRSLNFVASCGLERHVNIWNPFTAKVMGTLVGHQAPLVDVVVNDKDSQVISLASDNVVKIWDMRNNKCLQTIFDKSQKYLDGTQIRNLFYDESKQTLLTGGTNLDAWKPKALTESKVRRICSAIYSPIFKQVVVGEETDSSVTLWDVETGEKTFAFSDLQSKTRMSTMSFDFSGRRLLIGGQNGRLSMWNFNNGQCLKDFKGFGQNEVSCVSCLEEGNIKFVAAGGWSGKVCIWGDSAKETEQIQHSSRGHSDDVLCMSVFPPNCFMTGGYDGKVILWKVDGSVRCVLQTADTHAETYSSNPIVTLLDLSMEKMLGAVSAYGNFYVWKVPDPKTIYETSLGHVAQPGPICVDRANQVLYTSDIKGYVKAWQMEVDYSNGKQGFVLHELFCFRPHHDMIVSMIFIEEKRILLTASVFFTCRVWTDKGVKIGQLGQMEKWNLHDPGTWASKVATYVVGEPTLQEIDTTSSQASSRTSVVTSSLPSSRATSRGSMYTIPIPGTKNKYEEESESEETKVYPYPEISQILEGGPPHQRLDSWFKPLQMSLDRRLPIKEVIPFGPVLPSNLSFMRAKPEDSSSSSGSDKTGALIGSRRKKNGFNPEDAPPRLSLPKFRFLTVSHPKSDTGSSKSGHNM